MSESDLNCHRIFTGTDSVTVTYPDGPDGGWRTVEPLNGLCQCGESMGECWLPFTYIRSCDGEIVVNERPYRV